MKIFFWIFVQILLVSFVQNAYSSDDCQEVLSSLIERSTEWASEINSNLKSSDYRNRLEGLKQLNSIDTNVESVLPFIQDPHPQVRMMVIQFIQQQEKLNMNAVYVLHRRLEQEKHFSVRRVIDKTLDTIYTKHLGEMYKVWKMMDESVRTLDFSIEKAQDLVRQLDFTEDQWLEITQKALKLKDEDRTEIEKLAIEVYKDVVSAENDFKKMIQSLPFETSIEFFKYIMVYRSIIGVKLEIRKKTLLIIKKIYSLRSQNISF